QPCKERTCPGDTDLSNQALLPRGRSRCTDVRDLVGHPPFSVSRNPHPAAKLTYAGQCWQAHVCESSSELRLSQCELAMKIIGSVLQIGGYYGRPSRGHSADCLLRQHDSSECLKTPCK